MYADPNLKSAITDTLVSIINTGCGSASSAEEALKALEVTESQLFNDISVNSFLTDCFTRYLFSLQLMAFVSWSLWCLLLSMMPFAKCLHCC